MRDCGRKSARSSGDAWIACGLVLVAAVAGKFGAVSSPRAFRDFSWRDAVALGALMNTRGLMELVVLNIGYDLGILSAPMYTMMVIMALTTTCMAGPVLGRGVQSQPVPVRVLGEQLLATGHCLRQRLRRLRAVELVPGVSGLQPFVDVLNVLHALRPRATSETPCPPCFP